MVSPSSWKQLPLPYQVRNTFDKPQSGFVKLNYDGASKGNPGQAGAGGIFRDCIGTTLIIFPIDLVYTTNNEAELVAVKLGLEIANREHYNRLEIEGDSAMATSIIRKLLQGTNWEMITKRWRTEILVQEIQQALSQIEYIIPLHVRRQGNKATDYLVNWEIGRAHV